MYFIFLIDLFLQLYPNKFGEWSKTISAVKCIVISQSLFRYSILTLDVYTKDQSVMEFTKLLNDSRTAMHKLAKSYSALQKCAVFFR